MKIEVIGSGCPTCKKLYEITEKAVLELDLKENVQYVTDIQRIISMGLMQSPILAINDKPVMIGFNQDIEKIKKLIIENI